MKLTPYIFIVVDGNICTHFQVHRQDLGIILTHNLNFPEHIIKIYVVNLWKRHSLQFNGLRQRFSNCGMRTPWEYPTFFKGYESGQQSFKLK